MRHVGRIADWNDERGYGFVVPHDGGARAFVHVKAFQSATRRPENDDLISYEIVKDAKGRSNAASIRYAGQKADVVAPTRKPKKASQQPPRRTVAASFAMIVAVGTWFGKIPIAVAVAYMALSMFSFFFYFFDKSAANHGEQRTSEATLHLVDVLGGWPGALVAQQLLRHKTIKASFQQMFWITVFVNIGVVGFLVISGKATTLLRAAGLG